MAKKNKTLVYGSIGLVVLIAIIVGAAVVQMPPASTGEKVTVMMAFIPLIQYAPFYVAVDQGYYADEGLNVSITYTSEGSMGVIKQLAANKVQFGYAGADSVIISRSKDVPVVSIYNIEPKNLFNIASKKEKNITNPENLARKKVAIAGFGGSVYAMARMILQEAGVDYNNVEFVAVGGGLISSLVADKVDATSVHLAQKVIIDNMDVDTNILWAKDYSNFIGSVHVITSEQISGDNPELVKKFVKATKRGLEYAATHPNETADIYIKFNPDAAKNRNLQLAIWNAFVEEVWSPGQLDKVGQPFTDTQWEEAQDILYELGMIDKKTDVSKFYTNEFISK